MSKILLIETATNVCSVGVADYGTLVAMRESNELRSHAEMVTIFIEETLAEAGIKIQQLDAVAVSMGPGSYTGLRIGVSTAKGICYALNKPLIAIDTLQAMSSGMIAFRGPRNEYYCPMIDARRMEVYSAIFNNSNDRITATAAQIIDENSFSKELTENTIVFFGDGASKCQQVLGQHANAVFVEGFNPSVKYMASLAQLKFNTGQFVDTAYFEPFYLKDFVATAPKVKGLR
jgi:tRNA threonylcarbamoyladenosine biosynthesis protein TsaB